MMQSIIDQIIGEMHIQREANHDRRDLEAAGGV